MNVTERKVGYQERWLSETFFEMREAFSLTSMIGFTGDVDYKLFSKAWKILFQRQPMLRTRLHREEEGYLLTFDADFDDVPLLETNTDDKEHWKNIFHDHFFPQLDINTYCWKAELVNVNDSSEHQVIFTTVHTISDALSMSYLLGDLLRIIIALKHNEKVDTTSIEVPPPVDDILNKRLFLPSNTDISVNEPPWKFQEAYDVNRSRTSCIFDVIGKSKVDAVLQRARKESVTFTSAFCAAFAKSIAKMRGRSGKYHVPMSIVLDLRKYSDPIQGWDIFCFYAAKRLSDLRLDSNQPFWDNARQVQSEIDRILLEFKLPDPEDHTKELNAYMDAWKDSLAAQQFAVPGAVSNLCEIDSSFSDIEPDFIVNGFYFSIGINVPLMPMIIFLATIKGECHLCCTYTEPALSSQQAEELAANTIKYLDGSV